MDDASLLSVGRGMVSRMAICEECSGEMKTVASCQEWYVRCESRVLATVRLGEEAMFTVGLEDEDEDWEDEVHPDEGLPYRALLRPRARPRILYPVPERCGDCGVRPGGWHHPGCDMAECPCCAGQLFTCGCWDGDKVLLSPSEPS